MVETEWRKPRALRPGDTLGIVSPSSPVKPEWVETGVALLQQRGYRVEVGAHVLDSIPGCDYLAGTDEDRASDLNSFLTREDVAGVVCAGGGYGAMRLHSLLDWKRIAELPPKVFLGYSDITSLHLMFARFARQVTFHGPMVSSLGRLSDVASGELWSLLEGSKPVNTLPVESSTVETIVPGTAEGELAGGCLCLLAHAVGSSFTPDFRGKIVLIEDVGEAIYRADRFLVQLHNAGLLEDAAGFVIGTITNWQKQESEPPQSTPSRLWRDFFGSLGKPTIAGFPFGHEPNPLTLPLGIKAHLDASLGGLTLLEPATI